jgi:hypothetical protein
MKKAISPVTVSCGMALMAMTRGGVAQASPDVTGQKYSDASSTLSSAGYEVVVSTSFGGRLPGRLRGRQPTRREGLNDEFARQRGDDRTRISQLHAAETGRVIQGYEWAWPTIRDTVAGALRAPFPIRPLRAVSAVPTHRKC